jgi:GGDEF domain-containing protein
MLRARRFSRRFAFVLVGVDEINQRFDYRSEAEWDAAFKATADLLRGTRVGIDRVYRYGDDCFALLLPESGEEDVRGLVRRLTRVGKNVTPSVGEQGGPLPVHFGATFFPECATTVETLIQRAEVAVRLADKSPTRLQLDGAEAPEPPPPETLRRPVAPPVERQPAPAIETTGQRDGMPLWSNLEVELGHVVAANGGNSALGPAQAQTALSGRPGASANPAGAIDTAFSDLVKHLDETLNLLRGIKEPGSDGDPKEGRPNAWSSRPAA